MASTTHRPDPTDDDTPGRAPALPGVGTAGRVGGTVAAFAVALAAGAAMVELGRFVDDPAAAAEARYLATLTVLLLGCIAALGHTRRGAGNATLLPWTAVAVVTAAWVLPPGPGRGAAVLALLVAGTAVAACRGALPSALRPWQGKRPSTAGPGAMKTTLSATAALLPSTVPLAVAVQVVFRGGELLQPALDPHTLVVFLAMPAAAALTVAFLAARRGAAPAGLAAATVVLWTGGLDVTASVALLALAAGEVLRNPGMGAAGSNGGGSGGAGEPGEPSHATGVTARRRALLLRACAVAALAAPFAWQPRTAAVAAAAGLLTTGGLAAAAVVAAAAVAALFLTPLQGWHEVAALLALGLLLLPLAPWMAAHRVRRGARQALTVAAGLALAVAAARCAPALAGAATLAGAAATGGEGGVAVPALAAPLALLALAVAAGPVGRNRDGEVWAGPGLALQLLWSGALLPAAGLAAAYPWLRPEASRTVLAALGLHGDGRTALLAAAATTLAAVAVGLVTTFVTRRRGGDPGHEPAPSRAAGWALLVTALAGVLLLAGLATPVAPFGHTLVGHPGVLLRPAEPRFETVLTRNGEHDDEHKDEPREIRRLALVGSLVRAEGVADGTPVATVTVLAGDRPLVHWSLAAGDDLGEWAARRPAVAAALMHRPPRPWASWVAPGGDYLGQVYRAHHDARAAANGQPAPGATASSEPGAQAVPGSPVRLVLQRDPRLPPNVQVHVRRLEAWP